MLIMIALLVIIAANIGLMVWQNQRQPELGLKDGQLLPLSPKPNAVSSLALDPKQLVDPLPVAASPVQSWQALELAVARFGGASLISQQPDYRHYVFRTPKLGFRDDLEFHLSDEQIHVRSASRVGHSDLGVNRKRVEQLRQYYLQALASPKVLESQP